MDIFSDDKTSRKIGYIVPIKTTDKKYIINQLLTNIDDSLLSQKKLETFFFSTLWKKIKIKSDKNTNKKRKISINKPLSGSLAKVCTEFKMPDLTKKVPHMLKVNVDIDKTIIHEVNAIFFSKTKMQWNRAVNASQGINDTFSTGSQNQKPPHPNS